jgi:hypothetical protein
MIRRLSFFVLAATMLGVVVGSPAQAAGTTRAPVSITVQTVPALPGVHFSWDGAVYSTDSRGRVVITRTHDFRSHTLTLLDTAFQRPGRRFEFVRWAGQRDPDQAFRPVVTGLPLRANYTVTAAFRVKFPVMIRFVDDTGASVDPARITAATVKTADGRLLTVTSGMMWLDGSVPTYHKSLLSLVESSYALQAVTVDSVNAVDAGKQRFSPSVVNSVTFMVAFHDLVLSVRDPFFRGKHGIAAVVTGPDGVRHEVPFAADGTARLVNLPRGRYDVDIVQPGGVVFARKITLSRNQSVEVTVVGWLDLAVLGGAVLLVACGLLLLGRPRWRQYLRGAAIALMRRIARLVVMPVRRLNGRVVTP